MKYCKKCGKEIEDEAVVCPHCGIQQETAANPSVVDSGSFGWAVLGCCIPLVGLILFLVWNGQKPKSAKMAGIGALVSVICCVLFYVLMGALGLSIGLMGY